MRDKNDKVKQRLSVQRKRPPVQLDKLVVQVKSW